MAEALQSVELRPGIRLWKPADDVLHDPDVLPQQPPSDEVFLGLPLGECGGVRMANDVIGRLAADGSKVYGNHAPTHGADATARQRAMGAEFGLSPDVVPLGNPYVISAHGAAPGVSRAAEERGLQVLDVTCPLVHRTHQAIRGANAQGPSHVAYLSFGNRDHPELLGAEGLAKETGIPFSVVSGEPDIATLLKNVVAGETITIVGQTTNNSDQAASLADELRRRAVDQGVSVSRQALHDVCHTVRDRQRSTREIIAAHRVGTLIVVGSINSKNTKSLADVAAQEAAARELPLNVYLTNSWIQLPAIQGRVGVISGASTLAQNVLGVVERLAPVNGVTEVGVDTDRGIVFRPVDAATRKLLDTEPTDTTSTRT